MMRRVLCRIGLHRFTVPLFGVTNGEWNDRVVGHACYDCGEQRFGDR